MGISIKSWMTFDLRLALGRKKKINNKNPNTSFAFLSHRVPLKKQTNNHQHNSNILQMDFYCAFVYEEFENSGVFFTPFLIDQVYWFALMNSEMCHTEEQKQSQSCFAEATKIWFHAALTLGFRTQCKLHCRLHIT